MATKRYKHTVRGLKNVTYGMRSRVLHCLQYFLLRRFDAIHLGFDLLQYLPFAFRLLGTFLDTQLLDELGTPRKVQILC